MIKYVQYQMSIYEFPKCPVNCVISQLCRCEWSDYCLQKLQNEKDIRTERKNNEKWLEKRRKRIERKRKEKEDKKEAVVCKKGRKKDRQKERMRGGGYIFRSLQARLKPLQWLGLRAWSCWVSLCSVPSAKTGRALCERTTARAPNEGFLHSK